jgi:hypothetical protein
MSTPVNQLGGIYPAIRQIGFMFESVMRRWRALSLGCVFDPTQGLLDATVYLASSWDEHLGESIAPSAPQKLEALRKYRA